mmetsp:Transcript_17559/g.48731  ORF Transcript_17559/g.48731 Transcript_17559/m.48731 type:complete len:236 (-) Transcript_17559:140-847(-)
MVLDERQLDGLPDFLLLHVETSDVLVGHVRLFGHQFDSGVALRWEDVHHGVRMAVQRDAGVWLQQLAIQGTEYSHVVVGSRGAGNDAVVGIDHFVELPDDQGDGLDAPDLLLGAKQLALQVLHFILQVLLLQFYELELLLKALHLMVQIELLFILVFCHGRWDGDFSTCCARHAQSAWRHNSCGGHDACGCFSFIVVSGTAMCAWCCVCCRCSLFLASSFAFFLSSRERERERQE